MNKIVAKIDVVKIVVCGSTWYCMKNSQLW